MSYNGHRDPYPSWLPGLLIGLVVAGFIVYQVLT